MRHLIAFLAALLISTATARAGQTADLVVIFKADRIMELYHSGTLLKQYHVSLGWQPDGAKHKQGDGRTPGGPVHNRAP